MVGSEQAKEETARNIVLWNLVFFVKCESTGNVEFSTVVFVSNFAYATKCLWL